MIPVLIGAAAAVAAGAYALNSDDKSNGEWYVEKKQTTVPEEEIPARILEKIRGVEMQPVDGEINFCPHCGAKVQTAGAKFCASCGKSLPLVDELLGMEI